MFFVIIYNFHLNVKTQQNFYNIDKVNKAMVIQIVLLLTNLDALQVFAKQKSTIKCTFFHTSTEPKITGSYSCDDNAETSVF